MTGQIPDTVFYKCEQYSLIGFKGGPLPAPQDFGIDPESTHTGCYRGFIAQWTIDEDNNFFLDDLTVWVRNREMKEVLPQINGVSPSAQNEYSCIGLPVPFTGTLRIAKDFISECYIHMGFQKPSAFKTVLDVKLENGIVVEVKDRSEEAERRRGEFAKRYMKDGDIVNSIDEAFDLDLDIW